MKRLIIKVLLVGLLVATLGIGYSCEAPLEPIPNIQIATKVERIDGYLITFDNGESYYVRCWYPAGQVNVYTPDVILAEGQYYSFVLQDNHSYYRETKERCYWLNSDNIILLTSNLTPCPLKFRASIIKTIKNNSFVILSNNLTLHVTESVALPLYQDSEYEWTITPAGEITGYR